LRAELSNRWAARGLRSSARSIANRLLNALLTQIAARSGRGHTSCPERTPSLNPRVLLLASLIAAGCSRDGGVARIELILPESLPDETLEVRVRAEARAEEHTPGPIVASGAPFTLTPGQTEANLPKLDLPNGDRLVAIVEIARPEAERVLYYGISAPFTLAPGQEVVVPVLVGFVEPPDGRVQIDASHPGFVRSPEVALLLEVDSASEVRVSNVLSFAESSVFPLAELERGADGHRLAWSLDSGLDLPCGESDYCLRQVFVRFIDRFGYEATTKTSTIVVDTLAPSVRDGTSIVFTPDWDTRRKLERASARTQVRVTFTLSEPTRAPPILAAVGPARIGFDACEGTTLIDCSATLDDAPAEGTYVVEAAVEDRAGNPANLPVVSFTIDTTAPRAPDPRLIEYARTPWGSEATGDESRFAVAGDPDAIEPGATVQLLDAPEYGPTTQVVGSTGTPARHDGSFPEVEMTRTDRAQIYIVAVDEAGNRSESRLVERVRWTATAGSMANPHRIERLPLFADRALVQDSRIIATTTASDAGRLSARDGVALAQAGRAVWTRRNQLGDPVGPRHQPAMAFDRERGCLVVFGGSDLQPLADTREWDGDRWIRPVLTSAEPAPRVEASMVYHASIGRTLLFGGNADVFYGDTWTYDGRSWEPVGGDAPSARFGAAMAYDSLRRKTVLHGGARPAVDPLPFDDTWEFDGERWTRVETAGPSPARRNSAMAFDVRRGRMVLFGGIHEEVGLIDVELDDTWEYDGSTWTMIPPGSSMVPAARGYHAMAYDESRGAVILFGGSRDFNTTFGDAWEWVDVNGQMQWSAISASLPPPRANHAMAYSPLLQRVLVFGGRSLNPTQRKEDLWLLDARESADVTPGSETPPARFDAAIAYDPATARTVMFGGTDSADTVLDDTWTWDGRRWIEATGGDPAPSLRGPSVAEHDAGLTLIGPDLFGVAIEVWRWTGIAWTRLTPATVTVPTPRFSFAIARDPTRDELVLFGGFYNGPFGAPLVSEDMFAWTGSEWRELFPTARPAGRLGHAMGTDGSRNAVMSGGLTATGAAFDELWRWDGVAGNWSGPLTPTAAGGPSPRADQALAFDRARDRLIAFGGALDVEFGDLWEWESATDRWQPVEVVGDRPSPRFAPALAYDPERRRLVLFGGSNGVADTWELSRDPNERPAIHLAFNAGSASIARSSVEQIRLTVTARALDDDVRVVAWDAFSGEWIELAESFVTASAEDAQRLVAADGFVHVAVEPASGGNDASEIAVDAAELEVVYSASPR
jgi:hypothetical protein